MLFISCTQVESCHSILVIGISVFVLSGKVRLAASLTHQIRYTEDLYYRANNVTLIMCIV